MRSQEVVVRLISLVPPPRVNLVRYYGVIGARSKIRKKIAPKKLELIEKTAEEEPIKNKSRISWAKLLKRVFKIDIEKCPCGGRLKVIAVVMEKKHRDPILATLNLPLEAPEVMAARAPPRNQEQVTLDEYSQEFWG